MKKLRKIFLMNFIFLKNSNKIKNVKFIIRCHPSENFDVYKKFEEQYDNVFLIIVFRHILGY